MNHWAQNAVLVGLEWLLPAAVFFWLLRTNHRGTSPGTKLAITGFMLTATVCIFAGGVIAAAMTPRRLHPLDYLALFVWFAQLVIWTGLWRFAVAKYAAASGGRVDRGGNQIRFYWQGLLILLPVGVMALIGLFSLRQDKLMAESDARELGARLARQLVRALGEETDQQWRDYYNANFDLQAMRQSRLSLSSWAKGTDLAVVQKQIDDWQRAHPKVDLATAPKVDCSASVAGEFQGTPMPREHSLSPRPPEWLSELTPDQSRLWRKIETAELGDTDPAAVLPVIEEFVATNPPKGARANAELISLRLRAARLAPEQAFELFASSRWARSPELTEIGLPTGQLICYEALRRASNQTALPTDFLKTTAWAINYRPSIISPKLIEEVERSAKPGTESAELAAALQSWWDANEAALKLLESFREEHPADSWTNGMYWAGSGNCEHLLTLMRFDGSNVTMHYAGGSFVTNMAPQWEIHSFPGKVVETALLSGVARADIPMPPYARTTMEIGGAEFDTATGERSLTNGVPPGSILGEETGRLAFLPAPTNAPEFPFRVRVYLASPDILYSRQQQRTLLFGGLILFSALAALIGFLTARRAFYRQLRLNEMKSDFVSSVSHELRAPIASVRLMAEGLELGKIAGEEKQHEYFKFIVQECRRLSSLIENVLDFSRIEQGRKQYELESTDLVALTRQTVQLMETYAAERGVRIALRVEGEPTPVEIDGKAMQQALVNLLDNAMKHSPKGAEVTVGLGFKCGVRSAEFGIGEKETSNAEVERAERHGRVELWVEDKGEGIPASEHEKIFERFYRVGSELRRETQGVGIGLSIVKHVVEAHHGKVTVRSAPGQGSRFTIALPAVNGEGSD